MSANGETTAMVVATAGQIVSSALTIQEIIAHKEAGLSVRGPSWMKDGEHYGVIPGTERKDARRAATSRSAPLWKPRRRPPVLAVPA